MLDTVDRSLLRHWQADATLNSAELAERVGISPGKAARRLARMQDAGVIEGVGAVVDWAALGYSVEVSLRVTLDKTVARAFDEFIEAARGVPEVTEIQTFLGRVDARLNIIARDMPHYHDIYRDRILTLPHIADIEALMQIARIKSEEALPI
ncbi:MULTISPECIES: Lrp/AsnC family transcriptional regulator [Roseobacter]|uniref:Transcriptional regulator, asnC family n=1 Tax=Roseobacter litoralis (strain ATCC 49566 / DSM 6996 / JCM 21268 / NBRC 15278 / OCh 149) TaxID=391595 RepID=F7ZB66_ROSLO|nr:MULTISPECIES: Lrp/AsnC family transcriptional regulator [Roseobacter]AEI93059.1 putative transcriptional regulator, asnC family [Roseobacter litoralis Och 149]GIT85006.1 AsnC family transcriptional regulator [Roseobacter sp. OBYS 0001]